MIDLGGVYIDELRIAEADTLLTSALKLAESILGNQHPYTFEALNMLARAKEAANNLTAAVALREEGDEPAQRFSRPNVVDHGRECP